MTPHTLTVVTVGLAFASTVGGIIAIIKSAKGVGVALLGIGLLIAYVTILLWEV